MKHLTAFLTILDESRVHGHLQEAVNRYVSGIPDEDLSWGVFLLRGGKLRRQSTPAVLKQWCIEASGIPLWLIEESLAVSRDTAEAVALIIPPSEQETEQQLSRVMGRLNALAGIGVDQKRNMVIDIWKSLPPSHRILFNRLLTGRSVARVPAPVVQRALAKRTGQREEIIAFRLQSEALPHAGDVRSLVNRSSAGDERRRAYPFHALQALTNEPEYLGDASLWVADLVHGQDRVQLIARGGGVYLWSDEGEWRDGWVSERLKDKVLQGGTVLECSVSPDLILSAYDILEFGGANMQSRTVGERRALLENVLREVPTRDLTISARIEFSDWDALRTAREGIPDRNTHLMLRRNDRTNVESSLSDPWVLWRADPLMMETVLLSVRRSGGDGVSPYNEITLAVRTGDRLVPCARIDPSFADGELEELVGFVEKNTTERFGPVRSVAPRMVFTIGFDAVRKSSRRKCGYELVNPRIIRWNKGGQLSDAATLDQLRAMDNSG